MELLQSLVGVAILSAGCAGYGSLIMAAANAESVFQAPLQRLTVSFVLGFGFVGWVLFFPGIFGVFGPVLFWVVGVVGAAIFVVRRAYFRPAVLRFDFSRLEILLLVALAVVLVFDLLEGLSPPADADTLAYHFALPRDFLVDGQIGFVARAVSGAIPMLVHMIYAAALATGGELGLTLWVMVTGWVAGFLIYAIARAYIPRSWALALLVAFLSTPAVLYGGGSGQVEIRCAAFALVCGMLVVFGRQHVDYRFIVLAGMCAGFFVGAKFFGLAFAGAAGLFILFQANGVRRALVFGAVAVAIGFQWYLWNWVHTGDPVFPVLTNLLQFPDSEIWTREFGAYFSATMDKAELPLDRSIANWLLYPVYATFNVVERLEGGRTGLGILAAMLLPVASVALFRRDLRRADFVIPLAITFVFFSVWFFSGTVQRIRHLLPVYPLLLIGLYPIAVILVRRTHFALPLAVGIAATIGVQLAGQAVFSYNYARYVLSAETRTQFLFRNVPGATSADWVNQNLPDGTKVAFMNRQLAYLMRRPGFSMHQHIQSVIDSRAATGNDVRFVNQARGQGVTHLLFSTARYSVDNAGGGGSEFGKMIRRLIASGCLSKLAEIETVGIRSRTLRQFGDQTARSSDSVFAFNPANCAS